MENLFFRINSKLIFWILFSSLFIQISNQSERDNKKYYFCNGNLFDSNYKLSVTDISLLCNKLSQDTRFFITIQKNIPYFSGKADDNLYTRDTEEFFLQKCKSINSSVCNHGFMISIYTEARKIRITAGNISKNIVTVQTRENIISNIKQYLAYDRFYEAIAKAIDLIQSNGNNYYDQNKPSVITPIPPRPAPRPSSWGFFSVLIFIICPILCIIGAIYYFYNQKQEEEIRVSIKKTGYNCHQVHAHLNQIENMLNSIKFNSPPVLNIDICLICMQKILINITNENYQTNQVEMNVMNPYSNNNNVNQINQFQAPLIQPNSDPNNTRFGCGHVYHTNCLNQHGINSCMMCNDHYNSSLKVLNTNQNHFVDEYNLKKFMSKIDLIYDKECLKSYAQSYPEEINRYDNSLGLGLVAIVGITAIATTAIVADSMMHNNDYAYGYNQGYSQGYQGNNYQVEAGYNQNQRIYNNDENPDTAEGDY